MLSLLMEELEVLLALVLLVVLLLRMRLFLLLLVSIEGDKGATKCVFGKGVLMMVNGFLI